MNIPLLYALHSGNLYGTERMALATLDGLKDRFKPVLFVPPGPALEEAVQKGFIVESFTNAREFASKLRPYIASHQRLMFIATGVMHSLVFMAWNILYRRKAIHIHIVHGGTDEKNSYGRKKLLNRSGVILVAVSNFVRERLIANGVRAEQIQVIENFLPEQQVYSVPQRGHFTAPGIQRVLIISRVDPIKRVDLLLDALDRYPELNVLSFRVLGTGWDLEALRQRASERNPNVTFAGFTRNVPQALAEADLLLHLCPVEPFGLAILEAMAASIPLLVPDSGGAGSLVNKGVSGYQFRANDPDDLAYWLRKLQRTSATELNRIVSGGHQALKIRFSEAICLHDYQQLLEKINHV